MNLTGLPTGAAVYVLVNTATGVRYIGSTRRSLRRRISEHVRTLQCGIHGNAKLQKAWADDGEDAFALVVLEAVKDSSEAFDREQHYLDQVRREDLYNIAPTAAPGPCPWPASARQAASARRVGKVHSAETKAKIAASHKGIVPSRETREKLSAWQKGKSKWTPEQKEMRRKWMCDALEDAEFREKVSRGLKVAWEHRDENGLGSRRTGV